MPPRGIGPGSLDRAGIAWGENGSLFVGALQDAAEIPDLPPRAKAGAASLVETLRGAMASFRRSGEGRLQNSPESV
ncbi:MAG: hypothetical protein R3C68_12875 [Myxococcota bacterium]